MRGRKRQGYREEKSHSCGYLHKQPKEEITYCGSWFQSPWLVSKSSMGHMMLQALRKSRGNR